MNRKVGEGWLREKTEKEEGREVWLAGSELRGGDRESFRELGEESMVARE